MHHGPELTVVIFLCVALTVGALTRIFGSRLRLPYTVIVLLIGCAVGAILGSADTHAPAHLLGRLRAGATIPSDLIIFVFLPALIFESAFALDAHAFRKELGPIAMLAVPALLISTVATGGLMVVLTSWSWEWTVIAALTFGSLISATDPVAVVAILRETASPRRLGILVEGESLLNDGTAIVLFSALVELLVHSSGDLALGGRVVTFLWVVGGGVAVGVIMTAVAAGIIGRVFNDPTVEITLTIVVAYGAMVVAEAALHVSGVMAIVSAGLWLSGPGRTRISPEVHHFLHQFWEMISFLANTLIFFLVGMVVAAQWSAARPSDALFILAAYLGVMVIRFVVVFATRPFMGLVGAHIAAGEAALMAWGGLRGAVSLALALLVSRHPEVPPELGRQILLVTTGVVLLTILVNGSSVGWLLGRLGLTRRSVGERIAGIETQAKILDAVEAELSSEKEIAGMAVPMHEVVGELHERAARLTAELDDARRERRAGETSYWQQALEIESRTYWRLYSRGMVLASTVSHMDRSIAAQLDALLEGENEVPESRIPTHKSWRKRLAARFRILERLQFGYLYRLYDIARAQALAAHDVLATLEPDKVEAWHTAVLVTYQRFARTGILRLEEIRTALPELAQAIEVRRARRMGLNLERAQYEELLERGAIDPHLARESIRDIENQMKALIRLPTRLAIPETARIVSELPLFRGLGEDDLDELASITKEDVFESGAELMREGEEGDCAFVIARGAVQVVKGDGKDEEILDVVGGGEIVGEMALLTGATRVATVRAATVVVVGRVSRDDLLRVVSERAGLRERVWQSFAAHNLDNFCRTDRRFRTMDYDARHAWIAAARVPTELGPGDTLVTGEAAYLYLVAGELEVDGTPHRAPQILEVAPTHRYDATTEARVVLLPEIPSS